MITSLFARLGLSSPQKKTDLNSTPSIEGNDALNNITETNDFSVKHHLKLGSDQTSDTVSESDTDNEEKIDNNAPWRTTTSDEIPTEIKEKVSMNALKSILGSSTNISMVASEPSLVKPSVTSSKEESVNALKQLLNAPRSSSSDAPKKNGDTKNPKVETASVNALKKLLTVPLVPMNASPAATAAIKDIISTPTTKDSKKNSSGKAAPVSAKASPKQIPQVAPQSSKKPPTHNNNHLNNGSNGGTVTKSGSNPSLYGPANYYAGSTLLNSPAPTALPLPTFDLDHSDFFDGFALPPPPTHQLSTSISSSPLSNNSAANSGRSKGSGVDPRMIKGSPSAEVGSEKLKNLLKITPPVSAKK